MLEDSDLNQRERSILLFDLVAEFLGIVTTRGSLQIVNMPWKANWMLRYVTEM